MGERAALEDGGRRRAPRNAERRVRKSMEGIIISLKGRVKAFSNMLLRIFPLYSEVQNTPWGNDARGPNPRGRQQGNGGGRAAPMTAADFEAERLAYRQKMEAEKGGKQVSERKARMYLSLSRSSASSVTLEHLIHF